MATVPPRDIDAGGSQRIMSLDRAPVAQARVLAPLREDRVSLTDDPGFRLSDAVRARPGRLGALSVSRGKSVLYGAFVWARGGLTTQTGDFRPRQFDEEEAAPMRVSATEEAKLTPVPHGARHCHRVCQSVRRY